MSLVCPVNLCNLTEAEFNSNALLTIAVIIVRGSKRASLNPSASVLKPLAAIASLLNFALPFSVSLAISRISLLDSSTAA